MPPLIRRREVWLPTAWGLLVVLGVCALTLLLAARGANSFFALDEPVATADGRGARLLVVEGWLGERELEQAIAIVRAGHYERIVTSGGPIESFTTYASFAERAADYLRTHGLTGLRIDAVPSPRTQQDRTYASAVWVRDWAARQGLAVTSLDVLTHDVHARRTRLLYRMAFGPEVAVGVRSTVSTEVDSRRWWTSSQAFKTLLGEALSLAYTKCCFWPASRGSHEERWAVPPAAKRP